MSYTELAFTIGFLLAGSALVYWLAGDDDEKEEPPSVYERLQIAGRN